MYHKQSGGAGGYLSSTSKTLALERNFLTSPSNGNLLSLIRNDSRGTENPILAGDAAWKVLRENLLKLLPPPNLKHLPPMHVRITIVWLEMEHLDMRLCE